MRQRPMAGLLESLVSLDAADFKFHGEPAHFPFTLNAKGYKGGKATVDAKMSSQILSALLLAAPCSSKGSRQAVGPIKLICPEVRPHYVEITLKMREAFGAASIVPTKAGEYDLPLASYSAPSSGSYAIEPDISAASYFLALTLIHGGSLRIPNLSDDPLQSDAHFVEVLAQHGLQVDASRDEWTATCSETNIPQRGHREINFNTISDTFLTYAAIAPLLGDSVRITGIAHTRHQETDRIRRHGRRTLQARPASQRGRRCPHHSTQTQRASRPRDAGTQGRPAAQYRHLRRPPLRNELCRARQLRSTR